MEKLACFYDTPDLSLTEESDKSCWQEVRNNSCPTDQAGKPKTKAATRSVASVNLADSLLSLKEEAKLPSNKPTSPPRQKAIAQLDSKKVVIVTDK